MKIKFNIIRTNGDEIYLPFAYNHFLQGIIYNFFEANSAEWLHDEGFKYGKRSFKLFVFSDIVERAKIDKIKNKFIFPQIISFYLASPVGWIFKQAAQNLIKSKKVRLGNNMCSIESIQVLDQEAINDNKIKVKTLSPITIHSTLRKPDGKKLTYYYNPFEDGFNELINLNIKKKWKSLYNEDYSGGDIKIKALFDRCKDVYKREKVRVFKGTLVKGWTGMFELIGDPKLLQFALDVGLGNRNSQGYGMILPVSH